MDGSSNYCLVTLWGPFKTDINILSEQIKTLVNDTENNIIYKHIEMCAMREYMNGYYASTDFNFPGLFPRLNQYFLTNETPRCSCYLPFFGYSSFKNTLSVTDMNNINKSISDNKNFFINTDTNIGNVAHIHIDLSKKSKQEVELFLSTITNIIQSNVFDLTDNNVINNDRITFDIDIYDESISKKWSYLDDWSFELFKQNGVSFGEGSNGYKSKRPASYPSMNTNTILSNWKHHSHPLSERVKTLNDLLCIVKKHVETKPVIIWGALLSFLRCNDINPNDVDIDVALVGCNKSKLFSYSFLKDLNDNNFLIKQINFSKGAIAIEKENFWVDLELWEPCNDKYIYGFSRHVKTNYQMGIDTYPHKVDKMVLDDVITYNYKGYEFYVPRYSVAYVNQTYVTWKIPLRQGSQYYLQTYNNVQINSSMILFEHLYSSKINYVVVKYNNEQYLSHNTLNVYMTIITDNDVELNKQLKLRFDELSIPISFKSENNTDNTKTTIEIVYKNIKTYITLYSVRNYDLHYVHKSQSFDNVRFLTNMLNTKVLTDEYVCVPNIDCECSYRFIELSNKIDEQNNKKYITENIKKMKQPINKILSKYLL
jgi:hypothetical protein